MAITTAPYDQVPKVVSAGYDSSVAHKLHRLWETKPGVIGWLSSVDHKEIGIRYIVTAFLFLIVGGIEALIFRLQLTSAELHLLTPEQYDQLFTMHGDHHDPVVRLSRSHWI